jgi:hypothetical protein
MELASRETLKMKLMRDRNYGGSKLGRRLRIDPERDPEAPLNSYVRRQEEKSCQSTSTACCVSPVRRTKRA